VTRPGGATVRVWLTLSLLAAASPLHAQQTQGLTGAAQVLRAYDAIVDARFDDVHLDRTCPPAPREVCQLLEAVSVWWQIQLDPLSRTLDADFESRVDRAIEATEAWTGREPRRAEAWFYLGGAYGARAQWRVLRSQQLGAARDGKRIKDALERALALDPRLQEAYFGIGLYRYYADVAPTAAKLLRWLLLLPGGNRVEGLRDMLRARDAGQLLRDEADYQLQVIYLWYEHNVPEALALLRGLRTRRPHSPLFPQLIAETEDTYLHDVAASLRSWQALLDAARAGSVARPDLAEVRARLGLALQFDRLAETDVAIDHLRVVVERRPAAPAGALAQAHLRLGLALDRLGDRTGAVTAYRAALAATAGGDPLSVAPEARRGLREVPSSVVTRSYRLSLEGWRAFQRGALTQADTLLGQALMLTPTEGTTRYRRAQLLMAQGHDDAALADLEMVLLVPDTTPPVHVAAACLDAARLHEARHDTTRAIELYHLAHDAFGADQRTVESATRALTRLGAL
jgi:tetratricopeptide (TPR) repeat protein